MTTKKLEYQGWGKTDERVEVPDEPPFGERKQEQEIRRAPITSELETPENSGLPISRAASTGQLANLEHADLGGVWGRAASHGSRRDGPCK